MSDASAHELAEPMFRLQYPQQAALLASEDQKATANLADLTSLRRR
jgi:hypothetical protein